MGKPYSSEIQKLRESYLWALDVSIDTLTSFVEDSYDLPLLAVGSGGSLTAANIAALLHENTTKVSKSITPLQLLSIRTSLRKTSVILLTGRGVNSDILTAFKYAAISEPRHLMAVCTRLKSPLFNLAREFKYIKFLNFNLPSGKDGFLATNSLVALSTILCRAYQDVTLTSSTLPADLIPEKGFYDEFCNLIPILNRKTWVILYGRNGYPAAIDIESKFTEAAIGQTQLADYRNFAHGRHFWLAQHGEDTGVISLITPEDDIADRTLNLIPKNIPIIRISTSYTGPVGALHLLIKILYLVDIVGVAKNIDPGKPTIPTFGRKIYHLKINPLSIKKPFQQGLSRAEKIAIERKIDNFHLLDNELLTFWKKAYKAFIHQLEQTYFCSIVFDYDGTLCDPDERYEGPPKEIIKELLRLLKRNIIVGIATGRGKSVRNDLQRFIPEEYWEKIVIGYYNGSDIATLKNQLHPDKNIPPDLFLKEICDILDSNKLFRHVAQFELRPKQITVFPIKSHLWNQTRRILFDIISKEKKVNIQVVESSHSIDIISLGVTKRNLVEAMKDMAGHQNNSKYFLCIGDRGEWPGNDYELLSSPYSLSVDYTSPDPNSCWNLALPGHRGVQATLDYFNSFIINESYFRVNTKLIGWKKNER